MNIPKYFKDKTRGLDFIYGYESALKDIDKVISLWNIQMIEELKQKLKELRK